jgi:hypothetical protein
VLYGIAGLSAVTVVRRWLIQGPAMGEGTWQPTAFPGSLTVELRAAFGSQTVSFDDVPTPVAPANCVAARRQSEDRYLCIGLRT